MDGHTFKLYMYSIELYNFLSLNGLMIVRYFYIHLIVTNANDNKRSNFWEKYKAKSSYSWLEEGMIK